MREVLSFLTTIPTGRMSLDDTAKRSYLFPVAAVFIGFLVGFFSSSFFHYLPPPLAALLTLLVLYIICGINHIDGLSDFADGICAMGNKKRKLKAMKDVNLGVAGVLALFFLLSFYLFGFYEITGAVSLIIVAEVSAKTAMLTALFFGKPRGEGMGDVFIKHLNRRMYPFSVLFSLAVCFYLAGGEGLVALAASIVLALYAVSISHRNFGCTTGDVVGAVNEVARAASLVILALLIY